MAMECKYSKSYIKFIKVVEIEEVVEHDFMQIVIGRKFLCRVEDGIIEVKEFMVLAVQFDELDEVAEILLC